MLPKCPSCDSENIQQAMASSKAKFEFDKNDKLSAMKFDSDSQIKDLEIQCGDCKAQLIATKQGYRLAD